LKLFIGQFIILEMIYIKTKGEIEIMKEGGRRLRQVIQYLLPTVKEGLTTARINEKAESLIKEFGGEPSFKKVRNYCWATCLTVNDQVVHTPPTERILNKGDLLTVDIGFYYQGFHTDYATSLQIGKEKDKKIEEFLFTGKEALTKAINQAKVNNHLGGISDAIEKTICGKGFFIIKRLTGHGIGRNLHEDPFILGYLDRPKDKTLRLKEGLTLAVEVIYSTGTEEIMTEKGNNWSLVTVDHSLSACFEKTIAITNDGPVILT